MSAGLARRSDRRRAVPECRYLVDRGAIVSTARLIWGASSCKRDTPERFDGHGRRAAGAVSWALVMLIYDDGPCRRPRTMIRHLVPSRGSRGAMVRMVVLGVAMGVTAAGCST